MTIQKTYYVQIDHLDGSIDHTPVKATTVKHANELAQGFYKDETVTYVSVSTNAEYKQFMHSFARGRTDIFQATRWGRRGKYIFQHKGRKRKGCKNYPTPRRGWRRPGPVFTWTETYAEPVTDFLKSWLGFLKEPQPPHEAAA